MTLKITCDNILEVYLDGVQQQDNKLKAWNAESTFVTPDRLSLIALKCTNTGGPAGILASLQNEGGDVVFYTNTNWKCSSVLEEGWQLSEFQATSDNWQNAAKRGDHGSTTWGYIGEISHDADWIWAAKNEATVYCHGVVTVKGKLYASLLLKPFCKLHSSQIHEAYYI